MRRQWFVFVAECVKLASKDLETIPELKKISYSKPKIVSSFCVV